MVPIYFLLDPVISPPRGQAGRPGLKASDYKDVGKGGCRLHGRGIGFRQEGYHFYRIGEFNQRLRGCGVY